MRTDSNALALAAASRRRGGLGGLRVPTGASIRTVRALDTPEPLVAAAQVLAHQQIDRLAKKPTTDRWQTEAWELYDEIGELRFIGDRQARGVSQVELFIGKAEGASATPVRSDDPLAVELQTVLFGSKAATEQFLYRAAQQLIFNGDSVFHCKQDGGRIATYARSVSEIQGRPGDWSFSDGINPPEKVGADEVVIRCWRPHPQWYGRATAPVRAVLPVARELRGLTQFVSAQIDSRLAGAGILLVPQEIESMWTAQQELADGEEPMTFAEELTEYFLTPIKDRDSAAAVVPFMATLPADMIDKVKHLSFSTPLDEHLADMRDEAIRRVGLGMDSDPSVLLGQDAGSHWSAWAVDANEIRFGVEPHAALICHALTVGLLRPLLEQRGADDVEDWQVWYDATLLIVRDDRSKDAQALFDKKALGAAALRRENGFDDTDAPDDDETTRDVLLGLVSSRPDWADKILPILGIDIPGITDVADGEVAADAPDPPTPPAPPGEGTAPEAPDGPPVMGETEATQ